MMMHEGWWNLVMILLYGFALVLAGYPNLYISGSSTMIPIFFEIALSKINWFITCNELFTCLLM